MDRTEDLYLEVNEEQRSAIGHGAGPLLVIAGAGTGKTRVITSRIAHLISSGVEPGNILALTFTDKAAQEMEERVDLLVPYGYSNVSISTFHSFGDRVLRDNALSLGLPPDFTLLSESECIIFLKKHLFDLPLRYYRPAGDPSRHLAALIKFFSRLKDEDITPGEFLDYTERLKEAGPPGGLEKGVFEDFLSEKTELAQCYAKYQELMAKEGYLDYGDQITLTLKLLRTRANVLRQYQNKFLHVLCDEFQDTNYAQFEILKLLAGTRRNITVVADDDQSIYKFRGAAVSNVLNFLKTFPDCKPVTLTRNYRSVQPILDAAYRLITHNNPDRLEVKSGVAKRLSAARRGRKGYGVKHLHFDAIANEAEYVAEKILDGVKAGKAAYRDYAVLVRARTDADPFLHALDMKGIPCHWSGNSGLFSREEIRLLICVLRVITDFSDNLSLFHLSTSPVYGISASDIIPLTSIAKRTNEPLFRVMKDVVEGGSDKISEDGFRIIERIVSDIERYSDEALKEPAGRVLYSFLTGSGYIRTLLESDTPQAEDRAKNIAKFLELLYHMEQALSIKKASLVVEELKILMEAGENPGMAEPDPESDAVQVLTVHKAKGLEFPTVFMVNLVSDRFPRRSRKELLEPPEELIKDILPSGDFHLQEERRLFYVGMTRAMNELYLLSSSNIGGKKAKKTSRFVLEALDTQQAVPIRSAPREVIESFGAKKETPVREEDAEGGETLHLSSYKIDDYLTCPLKYRFVHVLGVPLLPHHTIIYGKAVHDAISFYFRKKMDGHPPSLDEVLAIYRSSWRGTGFLSKEHEEVRFAQGVTSLAGFYQRAGGVEPKAVEKDFSVPVADSVLRGRWDLIVEREGGRPFIVDFKTSEVKEKDRADKKARESVQLLVYALAYIKAFGRLPAGCELHFVESGLAGSASFTEKDMERAESLIGEVSEGIRRRDFAAKPDYISCSYCAYSNICPELQKAGAGETFL